MGGVDGKGQPEGQVLVGFLVAGDADLVDVLQVENDPVSLLPGQPLVETQQGGPQPPLQQHLALTGPLGRQRLSRHIRPPQPLQQRPRRLLGLTVLVEFGRGGHGAGALISWRLGMPEKSPSSAIRGHPSVMAVEAIQASAVFSLRPALSRSVRNCAEMYAKSGLGQITSYCSMYCISSP